MTTLGLKEMGKFVWEGREKRKTWYSILGVEAMPLSLKNLLLKVLVYFDFSNLKVSTSSAGTFQAVNPRKPWNGLSTTIVNVDTHERYGSLGCQVSKLARVLVKNQHS